MPSLNRQLRPREVAKTLRIRAALVYDAIHNRALQAEIRMCSDGKPRFFVNEEDALKWRTTTTASTGRKP